MEMVSSKIEKKKTRYRQVKNIDRKWKAKSKLNRNDSKSNNVLSKAARNTRNAEANVNNAQ